MHFRLIVITLISLAGAFGSTAEPFPPYWDNGTGTAVHHQPVAWPDDTDWTPYSYTSSEIEDAATSDPSNGGTSPQNYVNVSSGCTDQTLPSIYYYYDGGSNTLFFRWRVGQIANTYGTGPNIGPYSSTDPWRSALWTVLIDIDGDGFREFAVHLDGSSGAPGEAIDRIQAIYSATPSQSIDYINDPSIHLIGHNPTAFVDRSTNRILNFQSSLTPTAAWPSGSSATVWDYGTTRASVVPVPCTEYFIDYQIPLDMLDAGAVGGPTVTGSTPMSLLFTTSNSLNNPLQKDVVLNGSYVADPNQPAPGGDPIVPSGGAPVPQPIVQSVTTSGCGPATLKAQVLDTVATDGTTTVVDVDFYYYPDLDGDGLDDDGGAWTFAAQGATSNNPTGEWTGSWNSSGLLQGNYLIGVRAEDAQGNLTYSYLDQAEVNAAFGSTPPNFANPTSLGIVTGSFTNACGTSPPSLSKSANLTEITAGGSVTYTLTISNTSSSAITVSQIDDQLPAGFTYQATLGTGTLAPSTTPVANDSGLISWTFAPDTIAAGSSKTLVFEAQAGTPLGTFSNSAVAQTSYAELSSNAVSIGVGSPRLTIQKIASASVANPGDTLTFTISYSNDSPVDVTGAVITDTLPGGLTFVSATGGGSYDSGSRTITWPVGSINSGEGPFSVTFDAVVDDPYPDSASIPLVNSAGITSNESAPSSAASSTHINAPRPAMYVQKDGPALISASGTATFTISYGNAGNASATGVTITDVIPAGWTFVSASGTNTNPGAGNNGTVTWTIGTVLSGASGSLTLQLAASSPYTGANPVTNTISLDYTGALSPVTDSYVTAISSAGGLTSCVTPTSGSDTSDSDFTLSNVTADDDGFRDFYVAFQSGTTYDQTIYQQFNFPSNVVSGGSTITDATLTFNFFEKNLAGSKLEFFVSGALVYTHPIDPDVSQNAEITTVVDLDANGIDTVAELNALSVRFLAYSSQSNNNARSQETDFVQLCVTSSGTAQVVVDKQVSSLVASAGDSLSYTIEFGNGGGSTATVAQVVDTLPNGVTFQSATLNGSAVSPTAIAGQQYTFSVSTPGEPAGVMNPGESGALTINVVVDNPLAASVFDLTNGVSFSSNETGTTSDSITSGVIAPELSITKRASDTLLVPGDTVTYTIEVINSGDGSASNVQVTDVLPLTGYYTFVGGSATLNGVPVSPDPISGATLTIDVGTLTQGAVSTITYQMQVSSSGVPDGVTEHQNSATVSASEIAGSLSSDSVVSISTSPLLSLVKSSSPSLGPVAAGEAITYTVVTTNNGSGTALDVRISDLIPSGTSYQRGSLGLGGSALTDANDGDAGRYDAATNSIVVDAGSLSSGSSVTVTFVVFTDSPAPAGTTTVTNTASVSASNTSSRSDSTSIDVTAQPVLTIDKRGPGSLAYPLTTLASAASAATTIDVVDATNLAVNDKIALNGGIVTITALSGTVVTVNGPVTASAGADVLPVIEYFIRVENNGSADATNLTLSDPLPPGTTYVSASPAPTSAPAVGANGIVTWSGGSLGAGSSATYTLTVFPGGVGAYANTATVSATGAISANDTVTTEVGVLDPRKDTSTPTVTNGPSGTTATYTITVENQAAVAATDVVVTDLLSPGFTYDGGLVTGGTATQTSPGAPILGDEAPTFGTYTIQAGGTLTLTFDVAIDSTVGESSYQNEVSVTSTNVDALIFDFLAVTTEDVSVQATPTLSINDVTVAEGDAGTTPATFTVTLSNPSTSTVTVDFATTGGTATSGTDFTAATGTLTFAPGATTQNITIDVVGDTIDESDETYTVNLSSPANATIADGTGLGTITDDDGAPTLSINDVSVAEGDAGTTPATFTVTLSNSSTSTVMVDFATTGGTATSGTDFTAATGTLTFAPGVTTQTITIDVLGDMIDESDETYTVNLSSPANATIADGTGLGTVTDDDGTPTLSINDVTVAESDAGTTPATFTVRLSNPSASTVTVDFATTGGTATSGTDFTAATGTVTFAPGITSRPIVVDVLGDTFDESNETFFVMLSGATGSTIGDGTGLGTITDDDGAPGISIDDVTVIEGDSGTAAAVFTVTLSNPSASPVTVDATTVAGTADTVDDFIAEALTLTFAPGITSRTVTVSVVGDVIDESTETFTVALSNPTNSSVADASGLGTILDDDGAPAVLIGDGTTNEGGILQFQISLTNPSATTITLTLDDAGLTATSGSDYTGGPYTVTFTPGMTSVTLNVPTTEDAIDESNESFELLVVGVTSGSVGDTSDRGLGTIIDDDGPPSVAIADAFAVEGDALVFELSLSNPSAAPLVLNLDDSGQTATSGSDYDGGPYSVSFPAGETVATLAIPTLEDAIDESNETLLLIITSVSTGAAGDISDTAVGTITDDDGAPSVTISDAEVVEGGSLLFTVELSNPSATPITLTLDDNGLTASPGSDYDQGPYVLTFNPGETRLTLAIPTTPDMADESDETMELLVTGVTAGAVADTADRGTGTILDDDGSPSVSIGDGTAVEGDSLVFELTLSNPSASAITLTLEDSEQTATSGSDYVAGPYSVTFLAGELSRTLTIPSIEDGLVESDETFRLLITGVTGSVSGTGDTGLGTIIDDDSAPVANLSLLKDDGGAEASAGGSVTYDLRVRNAGPDVAQQVMVTDTPGPGLQFTSASGSGWSCASSGGTITCDLLYLSSGQTSIVSLTFAVDSGITSGTVTNTAVVEALTSDPDPSDNEDTDATPVAVVPAADLAITKTVTTPEVMVGGALQFVLVIENVGPIDATNVTVTDALPANFSVQSTTSTKGSCAGISTITCGLGNMIPGETVTIRILGLATAVGEMENIATVAADQVESVTANNASAAVVQIAVASADIPTVSEWGLIIMTLLLSGAALLRLRV